MIESPGERNHTLGCILVQPNAEIRFAFIAPAESTNSGSISFIPAVLNRGASDQEFAIGEVVRDRDDDDPNDAVVVNVPPIPASEWDVHALGQTLAEANPGYPADAQTVVVVFRESLAEYLDTTDTTGEFDSQLPLSDLADEHVPFYAFPVLRLDSTDERYTHPHSPDSEGEEEPTNEERAASDSGLVESADLDPEHATETETEEGNAAGDALDVLEERLATSGMRVVDRDDEAGTLTIEKMRDTYRVEPGRVIEGDGHFRQRLEGLVATAGDANEE